MLRSPASFSPRSWTAVTYLRVNYPCLPAAPACQSLRSPGLSPVAENFLPQEIGLIFEGQIVSKYSLPEQIFKERCRQCYVCTERGKDNFTAPVMESGIVPGFPGSGARARCQSFNYSTPRCSSKACHQPRAWSLAFCFQAVSS